MRTRRTWAVAVAGIEGALIEVEAGVSTAQPGMDLIGLPDKALGEAVRRVSNACGNQGLGLPRQRLTVNLSPAGLPKRGAAFDLAIAVASIAIEHRLNQASLERTVHIGELGLDGRLRPVPGVLPAVLAAVMENMARGFALGESLQISAQDEARDFVRRRLREFTSAGTAPPSRR